MKKQKLFLQFAKYMVGGGVYFWSGFAVFALLYSGLKWDWLWAKIFADMIGWTLNFLIQRYWAFNHPSLSGKNIQVTTKYVGLTIVNFGIDYAIVATMKHFGVTPYVGMITASLFFTLWNYLWYRFYVFKLGK